MKRLVATASSDANFGLGAVLRLAALGWLLAARGANTTWPDAPHRRREVINLGEVVTSQTSENSSLLYRDCSMKFPLKLWAKWILLVLLSAVASFIAALLSAYNTLQHLTGIGLGIASFIVIYTVLESWAVSRGKDAFVRSLKFGVIVKIVLELVPAIDVLTGAFAIGVIDAMGIHLPVLATYLKTMIVGVVFSMVVFAIGALYWYFRGRFTFAMGSVQGAVR